MAHADFLPVVEEGRPREGHQKRGNLFQLIAGAIDVDARQVVVADRNGHIPFVFHFAILIAPRLQKFGDVPFSLFIEEAVVDRSAMDLTARTPAFGLAAKQRIVPAEPVVKVCMESAFNGHFRAGPLGNDKSLGIVGIQHVARLAPQAADFFRTGIVADEGSGHIDAEAAGAGVEPEAHHIADGFPGGLNIRVRRRQLPRLVGFGETEVQRRLRIKIVGQVASVAVAVALHHLRRPALTAVIPHAVRPDVAVCELVFLRLAGFLKPRVFFGGMPRHKVQNHTHAAFFRFTEQSLEVGVCSVARRHLTVVGHVIPRILKRRNKTGVQPDGADAQALNVIELFDNAGNIPDAVAIAVVKALRINFVKYSVFDPFRSPFLRHKTTPDNLKPRTMAGILDYENSNLRVFG